MLSVITELLVLGNDDATTTTNTTAEYSIQQEATCKQVCKRLLSGWQNIDDLQISLEPITGGLTNTLIKASIPQDVAKRTGDGILSEALVRYFGSDTELFLDRTVEETIFDSFSSCGVGPRLLGRFEGGRIEQFLHADTLKSDDCSKFLEPIGMKIAEIHSIKVDNIPQEPSLFNTLEKWIDAASKVRFAVHSVNASLLSQVDFASLIEEVCFLKKTLLPLQSPVLFCHNDLLASNLMFNTETKEIHPIDFEYGSYNFRGYEFGNHFCEWAIDYTNPHRAKIIPDKYPTYEQREIIFRAYLKKIRQLNPVQQDPSVEEEIKQLQKESDHFLMVPHLMWAMWSIVQAGCSKIQFGYMEFAVERIHQYFTLKQSLLVKFKLSP